MAERYSGTHSRQLLTGFLGSGKTTLLQRLLRSPELADIAVLINEFGEVGLDHHLLQGVEPRHAAARKRLRVLHYPQRFEHGDARVCTITAERGAR